MNLNTGGYVALAGVIVSILGMFHIVIDPGLLGQVITDIVQAVAGIATIYGIIHQWYTTRKVAGLARSMGVKI